MDAFEVKIVLCEHDLALESVDQAYLTWIYACFFGQEKHRKIKFGHCSRVVVVVVVVVVCNIGYVLCVVFMHKTS